MLKVVPGKTRAGDGSLRTFHKVTYEILIFEGKKIKIKDRASLYIPPQKFVYILQGPAGGPVLLLVVQLDLLIWSMSCLPLFHNFYDLFYFMQACNILPFQPTSFLNVGTLIADGSWHYLQQCQTSDSSISCLTCPEWCIKVHSGALNSTPGARAVLWMTCMHFTLCEEISHAIVWIALQIICPPCDWPGLGLQQGYCYHMICLN